jgi:hypothetical protein
LPPGDPHVIQAGMNRKRPYPLTACRALGVAAALALAGCALTAPAPPADRQAVIDRIVSVTAKVIVERDGKRVGSGSGVVVASAPAGSDGPAATYILTAQHVLDGKDRAALFVRFVGPQAAAGKLPATLFRAGNAETLDLAILRVTGLAAAPAVLATADARLGQEILIAGYPWGKRFGLFSGIVSQLPAGATEAAQPEEASAEATLVVDAASANGVSGGGVFQETTGELLGVVEGYQTASIAVESRTRAYSLKVPVAGETFVVPRARIRQFLDAAGLGAARLSSSDQR